MENTIDSPLVQQPAISTTLLNQNVIVLSNAVELAAAVIASVDTDLVKDTMNGQDLTLTLIRDAVLARLQTNLGIRSMA